MGKLRSADQLVVRQLNTSLILSCLRYEPSLTRAILAQRTGLNRSTVTNLVDSLIGRGLVIEVGTQPSNGGRPGIVLSLNPEAGTSIGVEIKDSFISVVLTDFLAHILWRDKVEFPNPDKSIPFETLYPQIETLIANAIKASNEISPNLIGIGLALSGLVNVEKGESVYVPNLGWRNLPIKDIVEQRFELPTFVGNGAALSALSERHYGVSQNVQNSIYIATSHIGIGGGIILNNQLFHGVSGYAGEIGHMVVNPQGEACGCGRIGCWETEIGELHVVRRVAQHIRNGDESVLSSLVLDDSSELTLAAIVEAARQEDTLALDTLNRFFNMLGLGIANLVNIFNPNMVVLGGILIDLHPHDVKIIKQFVNSEAMSAAASDVEIVQGRLPMDDACVLGAAALVLDNILRVPAFQAIQ